MTSKINIIIPACLLSVMISLAFFNVAYADDAIWRESNNLYNQRITEVYNAENYFPYRLYILENNTSLQGGETYSISFENSSSVPSTTVLVIEIDGQRVSYNYPDSNQFTFNVPEDYGYVDIIISSREYISASSISNVMLNVGDPMPYEPYYSGFRFDFSAIAAAIGRYVQPILVTVLPYIFVMIALIIGINAGLRVFRKTAT